MHNKKNDRRLGALMLMGGVVLVVGISFSLFVTLGTAPDLSGDDRSMVPRPEASEITEGVEATQTPPKPEFDGVRAFEDLAYQVKLGPRIPNSAAHGQAVEWIVGELTAAGWQVELQETDRDGFPIRNVIGKRGSAGAPWIVLGAHFDSRLHADKDPLPENRQQPIDGANDGASGVAVLLELARVIPADEDLSIWLVFIDAEDNGGIDGREWIMGSRAFVEGLAGKPDAAVILDMIGDADLNIHLEKNSDPGLSAQIWEVADGLGYGEFFIPTAKYSILDDHVPFLQAGIPAVDIIDFDYPYHHTLADSLDKVSPTSLNIVGDTMLAWLLGFD